MNPLTFTIMRTLFAAIFLCVFPLKADTLSIPDMNSQSGAGNTFERPVRGLEMEDVRGKFGEPLRMNGPIGNPPITRWVYKKFTVVFEGNIVIHTFVEKQTENK